MMNSNRLHSIETKKGRQNSAPIFLRAFRFLAYTSCLILIRCAPKDQLLEFRGSTMGTTYTIKVVCPKSTNDQVLAEDLNRELERINHLMSNWDTTSDVSRFNLAGANQEITIDQDTARVIQLSKTIHSLTDGVFEPTLSPLIELWGFGTKDQIVIPSESELQEALEKVDLNKVILKGTNLTKLDAKITLNLSAIAKGYGVDKAAELLEKRGFLHYMVEVGGETRCRGKNEEGQEWRIGIEDPSTPSIRQVFRVVLPKDKAVATSGDYRNYWEYQGKRFTHILDPRSGKPIEARVTSATVISSDCATADALATSFMILPPEESIRIADSLPDVSILLVLHQEKGQSKVLKSKGIDQYLVPEAP